MPTQLTGPARVRPSRKALGRARRAAGRGKPLSKLVAEFEADYLGSAAQAEGFALLP